MHMAAICCNPPKHLTFLSLTGGPAGDSPLSGFEQFRNASGQSSDGDDVIDKLVLFFYRSYCLSTLEE